MTGVYSGGLVYEYSEEGSNYGLVNIDGNTVTTNTDFTNLQTQLKNNPAPSGDGGYKSSGAASTCPASSDTFELNDFTGESLPAIPSGATKYMSQGAGAGPGLTGDGSQNAGGGSSGTATPGSGSATTTASRASSTGSTTSSSAAASSKGAASSLVVKGETSFAAFAFTGLVGLSAFLGAVLL